jgi:hypothetical protein
MSDESNEPSAPAPDPAEAAPPPAEPSPEPIELIERPTLDSQGYSEDPPDDAFRAVIEHRETKN